jgi:glycosyltransferase involved in cell wall biosynthesis
MAQAERVSVLVPAFNEAATLRATVESIRQAGNWLELLVVDDGSTDGTAEVARAAGATVIRHPYNKGNGAAVKTALRAAQGEFVLLMDADGQHAPEEMEKLIAPLGEYDLVVGARAGAAQATLARRLGNGLLARLASFLAGIRIPDLTSGFRAARTEQMKEFLHLFPNGFSYPTTSTLAFLRAGYSVAFVPFEGRKRPAATQSKMRPAREGFRFLGIILRMIMLFSPMRIVFPLTLVFFLLGFGYLVWTILTQMHVTNTSVLLLTASVVLFLFGLISEQIASLRFERRE